MRHLILAALALGAAAPALAQDLGGARDASAKFTAALAGGDAATAASYLADDAVALPPGRPTIDGKAQVQQFLATMSRAVKNLKYTTEDVKPIGDSAARETGTFAFKLRNSDVNGKYLFIWTKVGSDWKLAADMWNRDSSGGKGRGGNGGRGGSGPNGRNGANGTNGGNGMNGADGADGE